MNSNYATVLAGLFDNAQLPEVVGTLAGNDTLNKVTDTIPGNQESSTDTDWVRNPDSVYYFSRLAIDGRVSALFGLTPNSSMRIEYLDTQSGISSNGVDSGSVSVIEAFLPITYWKPYVRVSIDGIALDFPGATAVAGISLSALGDLTSSDTVNVDFISTAELSRAETLVAAGQDLAVAMEQAVTDLGLQDRSIPDEPRLDHQALVLVDMVWQERDLPGIVTFYNTWAKREFSTWPMAGTSTAAAVLSEGEYVISIVIHSDPKACFLWNGEDWQPCGQEEIEEARGEADSSCRVILNGGDVAALGDFYE